MKKFLTVSNAIAFILAYSAVSFYFTYQKNKAEEVRRENVDRTVQALAEAVTAQEATIKKLEQLVARFVSQKGN